MIGRLFLFRSWLSGAEFWVDLIRYSTERSRFFINPIVYPAHRFLADADCWFDRIKWIQPSGSWIAHLVHCIRLMDFFGFRDDPLLNFEGLDGHRDREAILPVNTRL